MNPLEHDTSPERENNAGNEVDLFTLADRQPPPRQIGGQVELFQYAERIESKELSPSAEQPPARTPAPDKAHYVLDDAAIPDIAPLQVQQTTDKSQPASPPFHLSKAGIAAVAVVTAIAVIFVSVLSVFLNFYSKVDYIPDDTGAYYYNVKAQGIKSAPYVKNILLIGTDERTAAFSDNARADSMILLSINSTSGTVTLVSLERGMTVQYLKPNGQYGSDLLTHVFRYGGAGLLINTIENTFKVDINGYVRVNFNTFAQIIDLLGGVDIDLNADEVRGLNTEKHKGQVISRKLSVGTNHLNGEEALLYARLRWIDSDFQRVQRQRKVILAVKEKLKGTSYFKLMDIAGDILPLVQTNISSTQMAGIILKGSLAMGNDTEQMTVPFKGTYKKLKAVDFDQNAALLQEKLY